MPSTVSVESLQSRATPGVSRRNLATIQVGLLNFSGECGALQYGPLFAAISLNVFGTLIVFLFFSQKIMKGLASGAVKG